MTPSKILFRNLFSLFIPTLLAFLISYLLNAFSPIVTERSIWGIVFFLSTGLILNAIYSFRWNKKDFTQLLFVCLVLRLLCALIFIFAFSFLEKMTFFNFAMHFLAYFIFYTIFEIRFIISLIKNKS